MRELKIKKSNIIISAWINKGDKCIILAPGLPQYIDKYHPFVKQSIKLGYSLFVPRYIGSYESGGIFTIDNCVKTIEETVGVVRGGLAKELYANSSINWGKNKICVVGFSFGAMPVLLANIQVHKVVVVCPFINIKYHINSSIGENLNHTLQFIKRGYKNLYRVDVKSFINDLKKIKLIKNQKDVVVIAGKKDLSIPKNEIEELCFLYKTKAIYKNTGHNLDIPNLFFTKIFK